MNNNQSKVDQKSKNQFQDKVKNNLKDTIEKEDLAEEFESLKADFNVWKRDPFTVKFFQYLKIKKEDNFNRINIATVNGSILLMPKEEILRFYALNEIISNIEELDHETLAEYLLDNKNVKGEDDNNVY
jgi:hypothetical protein